MMEGQRILLAGQTYDISDPRLQEVLDRTRKSAERPRCLCVPEGVEMYVAHHRQYLIKRMPGTGGKHHSACPSFEPDAQQSGLGELIGEAIIETAPDSIELRVDFPWQRGQGRSVARGKVQAAGEVKEARRRMSLRALTHFLFERAGLNRWLPGMVGKRNQGVVHKYLLDAAGEMIVKGCPLAQRLYVPEPFIESARAAIAQRRREKLAVLQPTNGQAPLAMVLGEFKSCEATALGRRLWIRHMPDVPLLLSNKIWERLERTYAACFEARDADSAVRPRLVMTALIRARREHTYEVDTASLMLASEHWIPVEGVHELPLIHALVEARRRFIKPLRYDTKNAAAFANVLLLDAGALPLPLHIVSPFMTDQERAAKEATIAACGPDAWVWYTDEAMPPFVSC
jgi:hypothetical protein